MLLYYRHSKDRLVGRQGWLSIIVGRVDAKN